MRQLLNIKGGIKSVIEHWVEQYHLVGRRYALSYCQAGSLEKQARSKFERKGRHPRVKMSKKRLQDVEKSVSKNKKQLQRAAVKKEKCEKVLEEVKVKLEKMNAEEANEVLADIDLVIDLEEIEEFEDQMSH